MIRLEMKSEDGRPLALKFGTKEIPTAPSPAGSVFLLHPRHGVQAPLPAGPKVIASQFVPLARASYHRDNSGLERLADRVAGWEGVRCDGELVECSRSLVIESLRSRVVRQQVMQALKAYDNSGIVV